MFGIDLLDFFRGVHPWSRFLRLIDQLGSDSRFAKAQQNDPELARVIAAQYDPDAETKKWEPDSRDWDLTRTMLALIFDALREISTILIKVNSQNPSSVPMPTPFPLPETEVSKAQRVVREAHEKAADDKLWGVMAKAQRRYIEMDDDARNAYDYLGTLTTREDQEAFRALPAEEQRAVVQEWLSR